MRIIILSIATAIAVMLSQPALAQVETNEIKSDTTSIEKRIQELLVEKERLIKAEKESLKEKVAEVENQLNVQEITKDEAKKKKMDLAVIAAENIENKSAIIDNQIELLKRNKNLDTDDNSFRLVFGAGTDGVFGIFSNEDDEGSHEVEYDKRTTSSLVVAAGLNNSIIENQSLEDSPYKIGGSRFFELG
ncbi:MAG: hypothetical protein WA951_10255, partial [Leeuwenhoekiella sp.]